MEHKLINKDIIEIIYQAEEKILDKKIKEADKKIKDKIKIINIEKVVENTNKENEIKKMIEDIEENYNIKIGEYTKEFYKQGVIDGINLMLNCLN